MVDINGLVTKQTKNMSIQMEFYAKEHEPKTSLEEIVTEIKPNVSNAFIREYVVRLISQVSVYIAELQNISLQNVFILVHCP